MIRMKYILQNMNVLNGLLAIVAAAMVYFIVIPFLNPDIRFSLPAVKEKIDESSKISVLPQNTSQADYAVIGDQNLFHPERIVPPEKKEEKAIPRPDVILYGTLITDQLSIAFVEDRKAPKTTPGRGKRQIALHKGDQLSGYILRDIEANRIVLAKGEERIVVVIEDGEKRKASETLISPVTAGMATGGAYPATTPPTKAGMTPGTHLSTTSPAKAGMMSGRAQPTSSAQSSALQSPGQKAAQAAPSNTIASPGLPDELDSSVPRQSSRRTKLLEVQKMKAERQNAAP